MLGFFKKKTPDSLTSKSSYYERECVVNTTTDLFLILSDARNFNFLKTDVPIRVSNLSLNGMTPKQLTKELDTPNYLFDNNENIPNHKVYFYKEEADIYRFLLQYHFIDDKLFYVANKIYTGMSLSDENKVKIVKQLAAKYLHDNNFNVPEDFGIFIEDQNHNKAFTRDGVYFFVNYIVGDEINEQLWEKYSFLKEELAKKKADSFDESLEKLL